MTVFDDIVTGRYESQHALPQTLSAALMAYEAAVRYQDARAAQVQTGELRTRGFLAALDEATLLAERSTALKLLTGLREAGFSWRDVARIVGVSVPAVQKWRRGEGLEPANHTALARLVALVGIMRGDYIDDPVSWLETDVRRGVHLSKVELLVAGRFDLVLELASDRGDDGGVDEVLDRFDVDWRERYVDEQSEVFEAEDGNMSIRARW